MKQETWVMATHVRNPRRVFVRTLFLTCFICFGFLCESTRAENVSDLIAPFLENAKSFGAFDCSISKRLIHHELEGKPKIEPWIEEWNMRLIMDRNAKRCQFVSKHYREKFDDDDRDIIEYMMYRWIDGKGFRTQPSGRKGFTDNIDFDPFLLKYRIPCIELAGYASLPSPIPFSMDDGIGEIEKAFEKGNVRILPDGFRVVMLRYEKEGAETTYRFDPRSNLPIFASSNQGKALGRSSNQFEVKFEQYQNTFRPISSTGVQPSFKVTKKTGEVTHTEGHFSVDVIWHKFGEESMELPNVDELQGKPIDVWDKFLRPE